MNASACCHHDSRACASQCHRPLPNRPTRLLSSLLLILLIAGTATPEVYAHEGHDHAAEEAAASTARIAGTGTGTGAEAPRLALQSTTIELVAVREASALVIYVDDYASNAPVDGLTVRVQLGSQVWLAQPLAKGVYTVGDLIDAAEVGAANGAVRFLLQGPGLDEQLEGPLPAATAQPVGAGLAQPASQAAPGMKNLAIAIASTGALLLLLSAGALHRRRLKR